MDVSPVFVSDPFQRIHVFSTDCYSHGLAIVMSAATDSFTQRHSAFMPVMFRHAGPCNRRRIHVAMSPRRIQLCCAARAADDGEAAKSGMSPASMLWDC